MASIKANLNSDEWHYTDPSDADIGPVTIADMREAWNDGRLVGSAFIWHPVAVPDWTILDDLKDLKDCLLYTSPSPRD